MIDNAIRYKFTDAPILAVSIAEINDNIIVLVTTVGSLHQLKFTQPREFTKSHEETQSFSVFHGVCTGQTARDRTTSLYYVINQVSATSKLKNALRMFYSNNKTASNIFCHNLDQPIPHMASCALSENGREAFFALAFQSSMVLYTMNCSTGQVTSAELKESYNVPRILTNLTGAFR